MTHAEPQSIHETIRAQIRAADGVLVRKSTVVDGLLDLRADLHGDDELVAAIDQCLGEVPGSSVTPTVWWIGTLKEIRALVDDRCLVDH